jgi:peptidyl-prolyl cis-trans isomerase D
MALINKIRERSGIAVAVIAIALLLFIVGGDFLSGNSGKSLFGGDTSVGEIAGTTIDQKEFALLVDNQRARFEQQSGRSATEQDLNQIKDQVWEQLIFENAYKSEFEKLGISVSEDELREMVQGPKNIHAYVRQQFSDQAGNFDAARHREFINAAANNTLPEAQKVVWDNFKRDLIQYRLREKYQNILNATTYVTQNEAKKEYVAQTEKIDARYLFVPFYSIADSTIKVSDSQISDYYTSHKDEFTGFDSRSLDYVLLQVTPTKEDSAALNTDIRNLAKGLASATNPQGYASQNSDIRTPYLKSPSELSEDLKSVLGSSIVGSIVGPFKEGNTYSIHKYEGVTTDSLYTTRASHILIRADKSAPDSVKATARAQAEVLLAQAKSGSDFSILAKQNSQDGSAQNGGDLGTFQNNGSMVKPFESAVFSFSGTGVIPRVVESDFGYHIINVTQAKSNVKYKLATVSKLLQASEATQNEIYQKAETLRAKVGDLKEFQAEVKKDGKLALLSAENITPTSTSINTISNAKEIVNWAFNSKTGVNNVSDRVFSLGDSYVVAALKSATDKDSPKAEDFKKEISLKIQNDGKAEKIIAKIGNASGALENIAQKYGAGALVESVTDINFFSGVLNSAGVDPIALGVAFGQKAGKRSKLFKGENGVFVIETTRKAAAPEIADYTPYKIQVQQRVAGYGAGFIAEQALRDNAKIVDNRAKVF